MVNVNCFSNLCVRHKVPLLLTPFLVFYAVICFSSSTPASPGLYSRVLIISINHPSFLCLILTHSLIIITLRMSRNRYSIVCYASVSPSNLGALVKMLSIRPTISVFPHSFFKLFCPRHCFSVVFRSLWLMIFHGWTKKLLDLYEGVWQTKNKYF